VRVLEAELMLYRCITNNLRKIVEREEEITLKWQLTKLVEGSYKDGNILRIHDDLYPHKS
jgi:hypothetical protein